MEALPVDDFKNGNKCCACGRIFFNKDLKRIRIGIVEVDILMEGNKKKLLLPVTDFIVCSKCFDRSYLTNRYQAIKSLKHALGLEYLTALSSKLTKWKNE